MHPRLPASSDAVRRQLRIIAAKCACALPLLIAAGCKEGPAEKHEGHPEKPAAAVKWPAKRKTDRGNFTVTVQPEGGVIAKGRHFTLDVALEPGQGAAAVTAVAVDADMPAHRHGMNTKPQVTSAGEHRYRAAGMLFHMRGEWVISVEVTAGGAVERASFPVAAE